MYTADKPPACDMDRECRAPVTHIDNKGFVYCGTHGHQRRNAGTPCRKLKPSEINKLTRGETLTRY